jgi:hypothetical protein
MTPHDAALDDEQAILLGTAARKERFARAQRKRRAYVITVVALAVTTGTLAAVNIGLARWGASPDAASNPPIDAPVVARAPITPAPVAAVREVVPVVAPPVAVPQPAAAPSVAAMQPSAAPVASSVTAKQPMARAEAPSAAKPAAPAVTPMVAATAPIAASPATMVPAKQPVARPKAPAVVAKAPEATRAAVREPVAPRFVPARTVEPHAVQMVATRERTVEPQATDSAGRVAQWMTTTYGKNDAERRAEQAVTLYAAGDDRTEHWRKVLGHLRATTVR